MRCSLVAWVIVAYDVGYLDSIFVEVFIVGAIGQAILAVWWLRFFKRGIYGRVAPSQSLTGIGI